MKTITITAAEERTIMAALQSRKNKAVMVSNYDGCTKTQKAKLLQTAKRAQQVIDKIFYV